MSEPKTRQRTIVKLCGLRRPEDIEAANAAHPDMVGFILSPGFRRSIARQEAVRLIKGLDADIAVVGVFVDEPIDNVARFTHNFDFDGYEAARPLLVQLHGNEDDAYIRQLRHAMAYPGWLGIPIIKAYTVRTRADVERACASEADIVLLDNGKGTGEAFDWSLLAGVTRRYILAGGLTPDNVAGAIRAVRPWGVDMSSGIETDGRKDPAKMQAAVAAVRACDTPRPPLKTNCTP